MSAVKKGLGRGFESLIPTDLLDDTFDPTALQDEKVSQQNDVALSKIEANPDQPRRNFDQEALEELAASITEYGIIQPIVVTPKGEGYQIVAGERRYRASKLAGLKEVPVIIRSMTDQHQLEVSLIENIQRRDLNAIETATAYAKLRDQFNLTNDQMAARVNKSVPAVINTMRLLKLPRFVIDLIAEGRLSEGQARPLVGQPEELIQLIVPRIVDEGWSSRKVEQFMVNAKKQRQTAETANPDSSNGDIASHHEASIIALRERLSTKVDIRTNTKGAGKIVIAFKDADELARINQLLQP